MTHRTVFRRGSSRATGAIRGGSAATSVGLLGRLVVIVMFGMLGMLGGRPAECSAAEVDYLRQVKPLLAKRCYACHGPLQQKAGLRLDTIELARRGGESGAGFVPGDAAASRLVQAATGDAGFKMPPEGEGAPLTAQEIGVLRDWIAQGAKGPADETPEPDPREHWSYRPPVDSGPPTIARREWPLDPLDAYIGAEQEVRKLEPRPAATPEIWLRRVWIDLAGVPPSREAVDEFLADDSPDAQVRVVDRLLAHPYHGQRWGRHWMDVWRYSDWYGSRGINEIRYSQRHIWRWRDWIVDAVNSDKPYDRMIVEMLAGDELAPTDPDVLRATGFLGRNWYKFDRNVWMFDTVEHTAQAFLAATLRCCRCHDHKYDPLPQEDYYRFRAFFEPHDVRTDPLTFDGQTEKDATLGQVPKVGLARVFDKQLDVATYVFQRGDNRYPDESRKLAPGVPAVLRGPSLTVAPVRLPAESYYPALRPEAAAGMTLKARAAVAEAEAAIGKANEEVVAAAKAVADQERAIAAGAATGDAAPPFLLDRFAEPRPDVWQAVGGQWVYENGRLVQKAVQNFATWVGKANHPTDFSARIRYRTLAAGSTRSVGFSFDYQDQGNSQDVYTSANDNASSIQAFHRLDGRQVYPPAGIVRTPIKPGDESVVEFEVRGSRLVIRLNGEQKLDYVCPVPRRPGKFALWVHDGSAEFLELEIRPLVPTLADLRRAHESAIDREALAAQQKTIASAEVDALAARLAAERAKHGGASEAETAALATAASRAERQVTLLKAEVGLLAVEQRRAAWLRASAAGAVAPAEVDQEVAKATAARDAARAARDAPDGKYSPLGETFPTSSTGRRLALARWIAHPDNPRTARVAVNHVWLRHFGQAIVPSVANFGLNGDRPSHPALLDRLALDLTESGWSFKTLHRRIVLSRTYALTSADGGPDEARDAIDRDNRYLWRMNSKRMEAEAVRDGVLAAAGLLDSQAGGPELPESEGLRSPRRSLYFRLTPNEKMKFLELFDAADPNGCYRRRESVVPQQALALLNSPLALDAARSLAAELTASSGPAADEKASDRFVGSAFRQLLGRAPTETETAACRKFLAEQTELLSRPAGPAFPGTAPARVAASAEPAQRAREDLIQVLFSHNDFVTVR